MSSRSSAPSPPPPRRRRALTGRETLLVIDRDPVSRGPVRQVLERYGYRVIEASSADEAAPLSRAGGIDLVVADALEAARWRELVPDAEVRPPALLLATLAEAAEAQRLDPSPLLVRPVGILTLLNAVRAALGGLAPVTDALLVPRRHPRVYRARRRARMAGLLAAAMILAGAAASARTASGKVRLRKALDRAAVAIDSAKTLARVRTR